MGRAVHIFLEGVTLPDLYKAVAALPEIKGIGYYPDENMIHIDTREDPEREEWVKEQGRTVSMTPDRREKYGIPVVELIAEAPAPKVKGLKPALSLLDGYEAKPAPTAAGGEATWISPTAS